MIEINIIAALLHDVYKPSRGIEFNSMHLRLTLKKVKKRCKEEGFGFLTKTLPRLGKAFDKAISGDTLLNATDLGFKPQVGSKLPKLFGEFFNKVLSKDGAVLLNPCATSVRVIRELCYLFYKYELPFTDEQVQQSYDRFKRTEEDLSTVTIELRNDSDKLDSDVNSPHHRRRHENRVAPTKKEVIREARILLQRLFASFDPRDIYPRHGPGAVATKQRLGSKYVWTNVSRRITDKYPFDEYFCSSIGHVCDSYNTFERIGNEDLPARVILVPKDSRGPRLISCEPVDFQWVQQGLGKAIVELVEHDELTKFNVFFTDQRPNQIGALIGSSSGRYATLDLNEASDRVSVELVRLLFPSHIYDYLEACRSLSTVLPTGEEIQLKKFAPMGSCLCFPILALTIWAILTAGAPDMCARESIHVYGDDVIVPTAQAANAIEQLESFGLKVNREKSCINGLFRESCGMDAFNGIEVTPVRIRTVWSSSRSPSVYTSWIAYANSFYDRQYYATYDLIVNELFRIYGAIPAKDMNLSCPSLAEVSEEKRPKVKRVHKGLQKLQWRVWDIKSPAVIQRLDGWSMLLRYFTETIGPLNRTAARRRSENDLNNQFDSHQKGIDESLEKQGIYRPFSVSTYTRPLTSKLVRGWR